MVTFKLALECEKGASTSAQFQKLLPHNQPSTGIKNKQEPRNRGHFAKCCNSSKRRVNLVQEDEDVACPSVDCNFIDVDQDSEPEYEVSQLESAVMINSVETLKSCGGKPRSLSIQLRSGYSFSIRQ